MIAIKKIDQDLETKIMELIALAESQDEMALLGILYSYLGCRLMGRDKELGKQLLPFLHQEQHRVKTAREIIKTKMN